MGVGIEGITISAYRYEESPPAGMMHYYLSAEVVSAGDGEFEFTTLKDTAQYIFKFSDSQNRFRRGFYAETGGHAGSIISTIATLTYLEWANDEILSFTRVVPGLSSIYVTLAISERQYGYILDENNAGVSGVVVKALRKESGEDSVYYEAATSTTDVDGYFELIGLRPDKFYIIQAVISESPTKFYYRLTDKNNVTVDIVLADSVAGKYADDTDYYDITMKTPGMKSQSGTITDGALGGVEGVSVSAFAVGDTFTKEQTTTTNADGEWSISGLVDGQKYVYQFRDNSGAYQSAYYVLSPPENNTGSISNATVIEPGGADISIILEAS